MALLFSQADTCESGQIYFVTLLASWVRDMLNEDTMCRALSREKTHKIIAGQHIPKELPPQHLQFVKS